METDNYSLRSLLLNEEFLNSVLMESDIPVCFLKTPEIKSLAEEARRIILYMNSDKKSLSENDFLMLKTKIMNTIQNNNKCK